MIPDSPASSGPKYPGGLEPQARWGQSPRMIFRKIIAKSFREGFSSPPDAGSHA